ncbi:MAG: hypothetical protein K8E24_004365, partial [Methanobacterium paludis]|nr:hypothetical protein [Methanobacterium paludis]
MYKVQLIVPPTERLYLSNSTYIGTGTQITINKNLTISGAKSSSSNEKSTLNANNLSRIFSIAPNVKVTLIDLIMTNGYSPNSGYGGGGAILNQGDLTITSSDLFNNKVVTKGGAISNSLGNLPILNSTLSNNAAPLDGGAIFNNQGKITITGS